MCKPKSLDPSFQMNDPALLEAWGKVPDNTKERYKMMALADQLLAQNAQMALSQRFLEEAPKRQNRGTKCKVVHALNESRYVQQKQLGGHHGSMGGGYVAATISGAVTWPLSQHG